MDETKIKYYLRCGNNMRKFAVNFTRPIDLNSYCSVAACNCNARVRNDGIRTLFLIPSHKYAHVTYFSVRERTI